MSTDRPSRRSDAVALGAALDAGVRATAQALQTNTMVAGMQTMAQAAEHLGNKAAEILKGDLFEYIELAKFNTQAAGVDPSVVATLTREAGQPHAAADILIERHGVLLREVQAKASHGTEELTGYLRDPKYHGMQKLVPSDKATEVQARAQFRARYWDGRGEAEFASENLDTARNVTGELKASGVSSGGTTTAELDFATKHPRLYQLRLESRYVAREAASAMGRAAVTGAVVGGAISLIEHGILVSRGTMNAAEAAVAIGRDASRSALRSGATGAAGAMVRYGALRAQSATFSKTNIATAVAAGLIDIGLTLHEYAKGNVPGDVVAERIGQTGWSTMSSIYAGAAAGLAFGPAGAVVGSIAGYVVTAQVYQSGIALLRRAHLADEEAARVEAVCADAIRAMEGLREELDVRLCEVLGERERLLEGCLAMVDDGIDQASPHLTVEGLTRLAMACGRSLKLATFEEFDEFMLGSDPLRI